MSMQHLTGIATEVRASLAEAEPQTQRLHQGARYGVALYVLSGALLVSLVAMVVLTSWAPGWASAVQAGLAVSCLVLFVVLFLHVRKTLVVPMLKLREWAVRMCGGDLGARIETQTSGEFAKLVFHVNRLSEALDRLANDMDDLVTSQTEQLQRHNQSLETMYEVAAALNQPSDFDGMMSAAVSPLLGLLDGKVGFIRIGVDDDVRFLDVHGAAELLVSFANHDCAAPAAPADGRVRISKQGPAGWRQDPQTSHVCVPITYRQKVLGSVELLGVPSSRAHDNGVQKLLVNVGAQLGIALEKQYSDEESHNLFIMQERGALAHELHDSLAQTVATLRLQVDMLRDSVSNNDMRGATREISRVHAAVDDANVEIRELLATFRAPVDQRGLMPALADLTNRVRVQANCPVYLQHEGDAPALTPTTQLQVVRIVGEALANARKYSGATVLRVLVRCTIQDGLTVLIEDDGTGIGDQILSAHPGEHLGLSIMRERAQRAGGVLAIESEPDEGTRVELRIPPPG